LPVVVSAPPAPRGPVWTAPPVVPETGLPPGPEEQTDLLTNKVFREGVDRITNQLTPGVADEVPSLPPVHDNRVERAGLLDSLSTSKLPAVPPVVIPVATSNLTMNFGQVNGVAFSQSMDLSEWSGPINVFRVIASGCMLVIFTIVFTRTIRSAFAS
jgi:hypothetical protein